MAVIDRKVARLARLKEEVSRLDAERKELEAEVINMLSGNGSDSVDVDAGDRMIKATIVRSSSLKFDEHGLAGAISPQMWAQISTRVLDQKALEDKVARGSIDVEVVAKYSEEVPRKAFLKITERKE